MQPDPPTGLSRVWLALRGLRAGPPGRAKEGRRRRVFVAALQQSEELFAAAQRAGRATQPLLLFYGLSQAGRAVAAARCEDNAWLLRGHGIRAQLEAKEIGHVRLEADPRSGAFVTVARSTGTPTWTGGIELWRLWASLPELDGRLEVARDPEADDYIRLDLASPLLMHTEDPTAEVLGQMFDGHFYADFEEEIPAIRAAYPSLREARLDLIEREPNMWGVDVRVTNPSRDGGLYALPGVTRVSGDWWARPGLAQRGEEVSELLTWWGILFALSMLARYEPELWTSHLDVDASKVAVALEAGLAAALWRVPELILSALDDRA